MAHLPPIIARQMTLEITFSTEWPPRTTPIAEHPGAQHREGGQAEPVSGGVAVTPTRFSK